MLSKRLTSPGTLGFVAERNGAVVAFASLALFGTIAFVGSMAVDPLAQRAGAGKALMTALVAYCQERALPMALDATAAGAPLYEQFGFIVTDRTVVMRRAAPRRRARGSGSSTDALARAISLDAELLGCDRSAVLALLANEPNACVVASDDAYVICWNGRVGPWLARTPDAARGVFSRVTSATPNATLALVRESNPEAVAIARDHGFEIVSSAAHMARGPSPFKRAVVFGRASHSHG